MTMKKQAFRRNVAIISLLCIMMIVSLVTITVSWFKNSIDAVGPDINTGKIDVSLTEYHFDGTEWNSVMKYTSPEETAEEYTKLETLDSFSMDLRGESAQDDVFYVIKRNEGSIPLDVSLGFVVDGYDAAASVLNSEFEVIGGFWYRLEDVTKEYREAGTYFTTGENNPVKTENKDLYKQLYLLNSDVRTSRLDTDDVVVYRLTCGYVNHDNGIVNKYNKSYDLNINFCVSQLGGLDGSAGGSIHYVSTEDELRNKLNEYKPGDGIFLESDITFYGDLVIDRPLKLYVQGHTLNIEGNLTVSYPERGNFLINTQRGGRICVKKIGNSGSMIVDIPNAKLELVGSGNAQIGKGDIYIENKYYVSASYNDGLIVSSSYVRDLSDVDEGFKDMTIGDSTRVSVSSNTQVGKLIADTNVSLIGINNYGNIETVDFRNVAYGELTAHVITDQTVDNISVQSRLENAGVVNEVYLNKNSLPGMTTTGLLMRYNENRFIDENSGKYHGNTRLINRLGGEIKKVNSSANISYVDSSNDPIGYVIEEDINITYVEKILTDDNGEALTTNEFIIRYTNRYDESGQQIPNTTLKDVLDWYYGEDLTQAYKFTIVCYGGKVLTEEDYKTLNSYTTLKKLDLSGTRSQNGVTPSEAFSSLSGLEYLLLPSDATLSANAFEGTALDEVTLQSSYSVIEANAFTDTNGNLLIKYLHLMQSGAEYNNLIPAKQFIFVVDDVTLTTLRAKYPSYHHRFFIDAEKYGDYFIRVISDDVCEMAVYVGNSFSYTEESKSLIRDANRYSSFDFNEFSYRENGEIKTLKVNSFDDYAFYGMIKNTNNSAVLSFKNAKDIGDYAFYNCTGITGALTFSGSVNVGSHAFEKCTGIEQVLGVDASNSKIGSYAFAECKAIYEVYAPGFTHVGSYAFKNCTGIYAVRMPQLYSLGQEAFLQSKSLNFLETTLVIEGEGWSGVHGESVNAFYTNQCDAYDIKSFLNYVVNFDGFSQGIEIPGSLPNVLQYGANGAFYNWSHFIKIIVPTGYESYVSHISSLGTYVHTKASVNYTGAAKYLKLDDTTGICDRWVAPYRFEKTDSGVQYIPADYLYEEVTGGARIIACFDDQITGKYYLPNVIKDGDRMVKVTEMDTRVFFTTHLGTYQGGTYINCNLYFGEHIRHIEDKVFLKEPNKGNGHDNVHITRYINIINFGGLQELTSCIVGNGTEYNRDANATEIFAPNVTVVKAGALKNTPKGIYLDNTHFPKLKIVENEGFNGSKGITSINLSLLEEIGEKAFYNCTSLTTVTAPSLKTIGNSAFQSCTALVELSAESVQTVGNSAFQSLTKLTTVHMPNVVSLGTSCFQGCTSLTGFSSAKLISMGESCFYSASALSTVYVPNLSEVPKNGFRACSIVNISLLKATSLGESAFEGNRTLKTLNAPKVTYLGKNALYDCPFWWINMPSFVHTTSDASWNGGFKGAVYGNLGSYTGTDKVSIFRVSNDKIYLVTYTTGKSFSSAYDPSDIIILRSDGTEITYDKIWREWTAEEEEIPFRIYIKGEDANTVTLAFLNGFFADELVEGKYTLQKSLILNGQTYEVTGVLNGVASKFDFEGRSLVLPVAIKDIPEYFAYQNTTLGGISAMGVNNDIGQYAFHGCTALKSAEFPNAISLQQHAFNGCSSLFNLNLNALQRIEGGQTNGSGVGGHFKDCTSLVSLSFPSLTYIQLYNSSNYSNAGIFEGCTSLASVSFGSGFNQDLQARNMFKNTPSLTMIAFDGCPKIDIAHDCKISETTQIFVSYANYDAFISKNDAYRSVTQYYEIVYTDTETGITYYLKELPSGEYEITLIEIPTDFALEKVVLPSMYNGKNIISLNSSAWKGLENQRIKTVVLPNDLRFFNNKEAVADSVESFEISEENSVFSTVDGVLYSKDGSVLIAYPKSKLGDSFALPATVTMISSKAFSGTLNLVTLTIGHKVTICDEAFYDCMKLQNVVFTGTETSSFIGTQTFMDCDLENSIIVWIPLGTIDSYKNAVLEDIDLYSKFREGTPNT